MWMVASCAILALLAGLGRVPFAAWRRSNADCVLSAGIRLDVYAALAD